MLSALRQEDNSGYVSSIAEKYKKMREDHSSRQVEKKLLPIREARKNRLVTDWKSLRIIDPAKPGIHELHEIDINELSGYIDWTFFFFAWKVSGKYPAIFSDPVKGS